MRKIAFSLTALISMFFVMLILYAESAEELKEKNRLISEHYRIAMESYYSGNYSEAIRNWTVIIRIDPQQSQAKKLIEMARKNISEKMNPLIVKVEGLVSQGKYQEALEKNGELLALDPTNTKWKNMDAKLGNITKVIQKETGDGRVSVLMRKSVWAHIKDENPRFALNASRYAWQLEPKRKGTSELKTYMETEYGDLIQAERIIPGMTLVEQKLQASLSNIYDGKYDRAILECEDVLALDPSNLMAMKRAGSAYYASGSKEKAKAVWKKAAEMHPRDSELKKFLKLK